MVKLLVFELKCGCPTSDAWAYTHLQHGCVQQLSAYRDLEANKFFVKSIAFICSPDYQAAFWKLMMSPACYTKYST